MPEISIIVPVYKVEPYLRRCVNSILAQTFTDFELILVDDGSPDDCPAICDEYAEKDSRIRVIHQKNGGLSAARNAGIRIATGVYLSFVDSDDWIEKDYCELLITTAINTGALMTGGGMFLSTDWTEKELPPLYTTGKICDSTEKYTFIRNCGYAISRIYLRKWIIDNKIFFPEKLTYEDAYFNTITALRSDSVACVQAPLYHYYQREGSIARVRNKPHLYDRIKIAELIWQTCSDSFFDKYRSVVDYKCISTLANTLLYNCLNGFDEVSLEHLREINNVLLAYCPDYKSNPYYKDISLELRGYLRANMYSPELTVWLYKHNFSVWIERFQILRKKLQLNL